MPISLIAPTFKTFTLEKADQTYNNTGEPTKVIVKQASQAQHRLRQDLFATLERRFKDAEPGEVTLIQTLSFEELKELEVWLTMVECNIMEEDGKTALFTSKQDNAGNSRLSMSRQQFTAAWGKLMPDIATEIHEKVLEVNKLWTGLEGEEL